MPKRLTETTPLSEAGTSTSGRMHVHAITAGLGSSGYYSPDVLKEAATKQLIKKGTPLYFDHATAAEHHDRPGRSVRDIAAVFLAEAKYDETEQALVGDIQVFAPYRDLLTEMGPHIGLSISGSATDVTEGEVDGKRVPIIEGLAAIDSVDFVTKAGRGGKVVALLEAARVSMRAIENGVNEATVNDIRDSLNQLVRDAHGAEKTHTWVVDFDEAKVWFEVESPEDSGYFEQTYAENEGVVELTGDRTEVRKVTQFVPVTRPDSTKPTTEDDQEVTMGNIQIEESEHKALIEKAGRVDTLESERDTAKAENEQLKEDAANRDRRDAANKIIDARAQEARVAFSPLERKGLLVELPLKESVLDVETFTKAVDEAAAAKAAAGGTGTISGFGGSVTGNGAEPVLEADIDKAVAGAFGRPVKEA